MSFLRKTIIPRIELILNLVDEQGITAEVVLVVVVTESRLSCLSNEDGDGAEYGPNRDVKIVSFLLCYYCALLMTQSM
jgi:hypothetical protein